MMEEGLIRQALARAGGQTVRDVRAGLGYTCVWLSGGGCGLAYTFRNKLGSCCSLLPVAGSMVGMRAEELVLWLRDENRLKAAMGLAAVNALLNANAGISGTGNIMDALTIKKDDAFGMVGMFRPILAQARKKTERIYVFERGQHLTEGLLSEEEMPQYLTKCSVVVLTATSIINHTIEQVLPCCKNARQVCLVGPSTPLDREAFRDSPVTHLAGVVVKDPERLMQIVSQGGGTMSMKPAVDQVIQVL